MPLPKTSPQATHKTAQSPKKSAMTGRAKVTAKKSARKLTRARKAAVAELSAEPLRTGPRRLRLPTYKSLRLSKRVKHPKTLPPALSVFRKSLQLLWSHKLLFFGVGFWYALLTAILVQTATSGTDVTGIKSALDGVIHGNIGAITKGVSIFGYLVASAGNTGSDVAGAYQTILLFVVSLALIWALRQVVAGNKVRIRDAYYKGMYPLIPFIMVVIVVLVQFFPLLIAGGVYSIVTSNGIAVYLVEKILWGLLFFLGALLTLYMQTSSLFALYIVTLPDMTPLMALRSARELVRHRRWTLLRKIIWLPIALLVLAAVIMVPIITFAAPAAAEVFFVLTILGIVVVHAYMYSLYRELLN